MTAYGEKRMAKGSAKRESENKNGKIVSVNMAWRKSAAMKRNNEAAYEISWSAA